MGATYINCILVIFGSLIGVLLRNHISQRFIRVVTQSIALCVLGIGIRSAIGGADMLCSILCLVVGSLLGEALQIEERLDRMGSKIKNKLPEKASNGRFTEGFVTASLLFCIGAMAVMGSIEAGINGDYTILISKSVIDGISAITFATVFGIGVAFSALPLLLYQGALTLLAASLAAYLSPAVVTEMSAVGGVLIMGLGFNILNLSETKIKVGNMLPAIFLPILYLPLANWIKDLFSLYF